MSHRLPRLLGLVVLLSLGLIGCDPATNQSQPQSSGKPAASGTPAATSTPNLSPKELTADDAQTKLTLSDLIMSQDRSVFRTSGDLRPFWTVSGRITNGSGLTIGNVRLRVEVAEKATGHDLDSAILNIDQEIAPYATVSFQRDVQLMLPAKGWEWNCLVDGATTKP